MMETYWAHARLCLALILVGVLVAGCAANRRAPVIERAPQMQTPSSQPAFAKPAPRLLDTQGFYTIKPGDTLYSIALDHGLDYKDVAAWNGIDPSRISVGQRLRLTPPPGATVTAPLRTAPGTIEARPLENATAPGADNIKTLPKAVRVPYTDQTYSQMASLNPGPAPGSSPAAADSSSAEGGLGWIWPTAGKVISTFNDNTNKGISIAGKAGQPVVASADGRVIFSGTGIRGFGKLIVIKHNKTYLSVYGHNSALLVKEGQLVTKGQKIAEMGNTDADQVKLHFEIRRLGKPVDPLKLLPPG